MARELEVLSSELEAIHDLCPGVGLDQLAEVGLGRLAAGSAPSRIPPGADDGAELDAYIDLIALRGAHLAELREQRAKARRVEVGIVPLRAQLAEEEPVVADRLEALDAEQDELLAEIAELERRAAERGIDAGARLGPLGDPPGNRPVPKADQERRNAAIFADIATPVQRPPWWRRLLAKPGRSRSTRRGPHATPHDAARSSGPGNTHGP
jgi:hypothetical protein